MAFAPYAAIAAVHVGIVAWGPAALSTPTKLALMPLLGFAVVLARGERPRITTAALTLLLVAIGASWLGDGAWVFFPFAPEVPAMLAWFAVAHVAYIALMWRCLAIGPIPRWAWLLVVWWVGLLVVLWPHLGGLGVAVAAYGLVLGATALAASRCRPMITIGALAFLTSDSLLAFGLFWPDPRPGWSSPAVMFTYALGQGLIAYGAIRQGRATPSAG